MQSSPSKAVVPPLSLPSAPSGVGGPTVQGSGATPTQNKTSLRTPRAKGPGCRDWTQEFLAKRTAKRDLRERLFVVLVKRMAQLSMARLVREEHTSMLSVLLGRRPPPVDVKGVGPTVKPLQENTENKCYCGRGFGFFSQHKKRCALCLDWLCDACVMPRVPLHLVNKVDRSVLSPTDVPMLSTCEECTRIAYAYVRSVRYRAILHEGRDHPLPAVYQMIMEEDQRIAHNMFVYAKLVNELRATDEVERQRRSSLDYSTANVVHNSVLSSAFQDALEAGHEIEQLMYSMMMRIEMLGKGLPFSGSGPALIEPPAFLQTRSAPVSPSRSASSSTATSPRSSTMDSLLPLPSGPYTLSTSTSPSHSASSSRRSSLEAIINVPVVDPAPKKEAEASQEPMWHPTTETDIELLGNVSTTLRDRLEEHRHFYDALHMQLLLLELRIVREVYVTVFQLSYELRELFNINNGQREEESTGVNVYLLLTQLLKVAKQELKELVNKIEDANWPHYEEGIRGLVRKRLDNRRLIDIPPFVLRELTPDALTVLVVAKFLGIVRVEEKKLELRTAKGRFPNTKKNFKGLETIVTNTCLKQDEEQRAMEKIKHVSHIEEKQQKELLQQQHQQQQQPSRPQPHQPAQPQPPQKPPATQPQQKPPVATQPSATKPLAMQPPATKPLAAQPPATQPPATKPLHKPPPEHVPPVGAGVLPLLAATSAESTTMAGKQQKRERALSLDEGKPNKDRPVASGSDREDGPVARPTYGAREKGKEAVPPSPQATANGGGLLGGVMRRVGMA